MPTLLSEKNVHSELNWPEVDTVNNTLYSILKMLNLPGVVVEFVLPLRMIL